MLSGRQDSLPAGRQGTCVALFMNDNHKILIPTKKPWLLPRLIYVVGKTGFEPATPWSQTRCATGLRYFPNFLYQVSRPRRDYFSKYHLNCGEGGIRTRGTELPVRQFSKLLISATHPPHLLKYTLGMQIY